MTGWTDDMGMKNECNPHTLFAQLPIEARVLFYIQSMSAWEYHCRSPHTAVEVNADLESIWNAQELTLDDQRDWDRMSELLRTLLPTVALPERRCRSPDTKPCGKCDK
jgi:hypothetical protein